MTKRKPTKHEDDVRRNLRKSAEINPAQSPHDGIHTCSKGCKKPGCNRGLRDTIEEQNAQIEALKRDLLEQTAAVRQVAQDNKTETEATRIENARLKAEVDALMTNPTSRLLRAKQAENAVLAIENDSLKAEVERLDALAQDPYRLSRGWQPMETAPKDGTVVLCWDEFKECDLMWYGIIQQWNEPKDILGWMYVATNTECYPTHWMPLPNTPAAKEGKPSV